MHTHDVAQEKLDLCETLSDRAHIQFKVRRGNGSVKNGNRGYVSDLVKPFNSRWSFWFRMLREIHDMLRNQLQNVESEKIFNVIFFCHPDRAQRENETNQWQRGGGNPTNGTPENTSRFGIRDVAQDGCDANSVYDDHDGVSESGASGSLEGAEKTVLLLL